MRVSACHLLLWRTPKERTYVSERLSLPWECAEHANQRFLRDTPCYSSGELLVPHAINEESSHESTQDLRKDVPYSLSDRESLEDCEADRDGRVEVSS